MAKLFLYNCPQGLALDSAYATVGAISLNPVTRLASINFLIYANQQAFLDHKSVIGQKSYMLSGDQYDFYFSQLKMQLKDPIAICYDVCLAILDTGGKSFFDGATDV